MPVPRLHLAPINYLYESISIMNMEGVQKYTVIGECHEGVVTTSDVRESVGKCVRQSNSNAYCVIIMHMN